MKNKYFIVYDNTTDRMIITKKYSEIYDFIVSNPNSKIKTIGLDAKAKILNKKVFLTLFLKNTNNKNKFYELVKILISGTNNVIPYLSSVNLTDEYKYYMNHKNDLL